MSVSKSRTRATVIIGLCAAIVAASCATSGPAPSGERVIHHEETGHYGIWVVESPEGVRYLRFDREGVNQSAVRLGDPTWLEFTYTQALMAAFALAPEARRVLVVGLGGGTLPRFLRHHLPDLRMDVVEIDPAVVRVARDHLGFREDPALVVHVADGRRFIEEAVQTWDVVVLDAYGADSIPEHLATKEFLAAVRERVAPGGLLVANLWSDKANRAYPSMLRTYEALFRAVHVVRGYQSESRIVITGPGAEGLDRDGLLTRVRSLVERWALHFDLGEIVKSGYEPPGTLTPGGRVLVD